MMLRKSLQSDLNSRKHNTSTVPYEDFKTVNCILLLVKGVFDNI